MYLDVRRQERAGWLVLGGTLVVGLIALWWAYDREDLAKQVADVRGVHGKIQGPENFRLRVAGQDQANKRLRDTIDKLKKQAGFTVDARFQVPADEKQPGFFFTNLKVEVKQALRQRAEHKIPDYEENLGFGADDKVPPDPEAPYLLTMLQLTEKAIKIAEDTPTPLQELSITHAAAVETGPENLPPLLREYPLTMKVRGSLTNILWILHQVSQTDAKDPKDYPLILRGLVIESKNAKPIDQIQQLDATFELAGMQFLSQEERDQRAKQRPGWSGRGSSATPTSHYARP